MRICAGIPEMDRTSRDSIPVTAVDRTIIECARDVDQPVLGRIVEEALRQRLTRVERLGTRLQALCPHGCKGTGRLRAVLVDLSDGEPPTESELESEFRRLCRRVGFSPSRQTRVTDTTVIGRVDFAFPEHKVIVELDGRRWHSMKTEIERDRVKEARLSAEGWIVLRYTWDQVKKHPESVIAALRRTLTDRAPVTQGVLVPNPRRGAGGF